MAGNKVVVVSGGFDPIHSGHIAMFKAANELGRVTVILNSDKFLLKKKKYLVMPFKERKAVLESIRYVDKVVRCIDKDQTVCNTLAKLKPDIFANGGDRTLKNIPETEICKKFGIKMVFNTGGGKANSSSKIIHSLIARLIDGMIAK